MNLYEKIVKKEEKLSLVGLGYVGLPIAIAFAKKIDVIGFDISKDKIEMYKNGIDPTKEVGYEAVKNSTVLFTSNEEDLKKAKFHIVAVPTPVNDDKTPDLKPVISASKTVGRNLTKGSYVVFESTVYPGVTEEICIPILEQMSGLKAGTDFKVGYSPERINPGDKLHTLESIVKVASGMDEESTEIIAKIYELVVKAGVYRAESIKVAEAAKVIENAQRDINIAFMNELSIIFNKLNIDTKAVLNAAKTKWNFLNFSPGLVGGHCIGVDPYYLTYRAQQVGYHPEIILAGRRLNDNMGKYVVENTIKQMIKANIAIKGAKVAILGFTFKENCPDTRNTRVIDIYNELLEYDIKPLIVDPQADKEEALHEYGLKFNEMSEIKNMDVIILAVSHKEFLELMMSDFTNFFAKSPINSVIIDVKSILDKKAYLDAGFNYFRL
ncbi:nucleotide sugar dehydrogenase [Acholeplasma equirhinis]|uniref:nucleotide sugar dehydrogenase n=1 Tax=Acholeplasma equirhinis TaxID=555393 RepID=UPI00197A8455|nr:nucleotide sugar dehydrogenase [Acholeplasma equirhinis]MBN3489970.1 nucleotide sugar dehydrogenase [Acholeplasma equirhinis]